MPLIQVLEIILIGLFAGFFGGLLGIGGSIIMIPALTEALGSNQHLYQAAAMIVNVCVVLPALVQHRRANAFHIDAVRRIIPWALLAIALGVGISELPQFSGPGEAYLMGLFGCFLLIEGATDLYRAVRGCDHGIDARTLDEAQADIQATWNRGAVVGLPTGLIGGLFGVGGGTISVPLQRRVLRMPLRSAIANSAAVMLFTSLPGAVLKNAAYAHEHGSIQSPLLLAAILAPTAIVGSYQGSRLTHRLPVRGVRIVFFLVLCAVALRLIHRASGLLP